MPAEEQPPAQRVAEHLAQAGPERDELARKLAQAGDFIAMLEQRLGR
ncbi:hypothetical protein [Kocuria sp. NPDC057446]